MGYPVSPSSWIRLAVVVYACNSCTWEAEKGEWRIQDQLWLHSETLTTEDEGREGREERKQLWSCGP